MTSIFGKEGFVLYLCTICGRTIKWPLISTAAPMTQCFHDGAYYQMLMVWPQAEERSEKMKYPKIKIITEQKDDPDAIEVKKSDLAYFSRPQVIKGDDEHGLVEVRKEGNLKKRGLFICTCSLCGKPKLVIDDQGETCLVFIRK